MKPTLLRHSAAAQQPADPFSSMSSHLSSHSIRVGQRVERPPVLPAADVDEDDQEAMEIRAALRFVRTGVRTRKA